jgi:hypothetical protein
MSDLSTTTEPKSDQLNADSMIGGKTLTIKVTKVTVTTGDQPCTINYEGDAGRPYKPGKSMRRVLVNAWERDTVNYVGRSMTLYCDEKVQFGGLAVGGIRISHMSHIDAPITMALTATRGSKKAFTVKPLVAQAEPPTKITREQQTSVAEAAKSAGVPGAAVFAQFQVAKLSDILVSQYAEVVKWIQDQRQPAPCEHCQQSVGHSESCPLNEGPSE